MKTSKIFALPILMASALILAGCEKNVQPTPTTATATTQPAATSTTSSQTTTGSGGSKSSSTTSSSTTVKKPPVVVAPGVVQPYNKVTPAGEAAAVHRAIKKPIRRGGAIKYHNR
jgi:hypothetical protein